ncbi:MAG TPA: ABC transporter permease [Acidimicrobiales bacterium]|nr:ABC transporter permease [Acidimicrobiales bacterium]
MSTFFSYAVPGIPAGCDFALIAVGLVLTFRATGVFNLAFGAQAFLAAFLFDLFVRSEGMPVGLAFVLSVLVISPLVGIAMDRFLYRFIPTASFTAKVVSSVGLLIAIPQAIPIFFGRSPRLRPPSLWLNPDHIYFHIGSTPFNGIELSTTIVTVVVVAAIVAMFRWTDLGLQMRAVVESRRLAQLEGISSPTIAMAAWGLSSAVAGLAGVLMLPLSAQISPTDPLEFTSLLVAGLTAAAVASLRSIPIALAAGVVLGIIENLLRAYLPTGGVWQSTAVPAFPFVVLVLALLFNPGLRTIELSSDPLSTVDPPPAPPAVSVRDRRLDRPTRVGFWLLVVAFLASSATWVPSEWVTTFALGLTLSIICLSVTLITGMSGQLSLCQFTFAGIGAFAAGQLASHMGMPVLLGAFVGGAMAAAAGTVVALVAMRVSGLLLTLVTLAFALYADQSLFQYSWSGGGLSGVNVPRPKIGTIDFGDDKTFVMLAFVALAICMVLVLLVQRGTVGRYLSAIRGSATAAATMGISLRRARLTVFALSAGIAGFGGALYGSALNSPVGDGNFVWVYSLVFAVVVITTGSRTVEGAVQAGMGFAIIQTLIVLYLPARLTGIEPILFAFGATTYAAHPEGIVEYQKSRWLARVSRLLRAYDDRKANRSGTAPDGRALEPGTGRLDVPAAVPVPTARGSRG